MLALKITPSLLLKPQNWGIGIAAVKRTVKATTHRMLRIVSYTRFSRRFRTNDRQLTFNRINAEMFTDTAESTVRSKQGNKYMQIYRMPFEWTSFQ